MTETHSVTDTVEWVGITDDETAKFEKIWDLDHGVNYNSYLIRDEKTVLVDGAPAEFAGEYIETLRDRIDPAEVDYFLSNHAEPDHTGLLPELFAECDFTIVCSNRGQELLDSFYGLDAEYHTVSEGDTLDIGEGTLRFIDTPFVHWPETMMTYLEEAGVLFSGDGFGTFGSTTDGIFDDEVDLEHFESEGLRYFSNVMGSYTIPVSRAIEKLADLDIEVLAPTHGPVWRDDPGRIIGKYEQWAEMRGEGALIVYGSMYGNTEGLVDAIESGLEAGGVEEITKLDVTETSLSQLLASAWGSEAVVIGAPTYDAGIYPPVDQFLSLLERKKLTGKIGTVFGSKGWGGGATRGVKSIIDDLDWDVVEPVLEFGGMPDDEVHAEGRTLGESVADRMAE